MQRIQQPALPRRRSSFVDLTRVLGLLGVVFLHSHLDDSSANTILRALFLGGRLSCFFLLAAYFTPKESSKSLARAGKFALFYLLWNGVVFGMAYLRGLFFDGKEYSLDLVIARLIGFTDDPWDYPMWFLRDLILCYCTIPLLQWLMNKKYLLWCWLAMLAASWVLYGYGIESIPCQNGTVFSISGFIFFSLGFYISKSHSIEYLKKCLPWRYYLLGIYIIPVALYFYGYLPSVYYLEHFLGIGGCFIFCYCLAERVPLLGKIAIACSPVFFMVYAAHVTVIEIAVVLLGSKPYYPLIQYVLPFALIGGMAVLFKKLHSWSPMWAYIIFGQVNKLHFNMSVPSFLLKRAKNQCEGE